MKHYTMNHPKKVYYANEKVANITVPFVGFNNIFKTHVVIVSIVNGCAPKGFSLKTYLKKGLPCFMWLERSSFME